MITQHFEGAVSRALHAWSGGFLRTGLTLTRRSAAFLAGLPRDRERQLGWLELQNKIVAYLLFEGRVHGERPHTIAELDPWSRLFATEGYAYRNARPDLQPALGLSPIALHAGAGLRLAEDALRGMQAGMRESQVLTDYFTACGRNSREGFGGITLEALGMVSRSLYPHLILGLDAALSAVNSAFRDYFWHGVGRAIYFTPRNLPPFRAAPWKGVDMCLTEPAHEAGRSNALSGFAFALTLVNLRQLEILEAFQEQHARLASDCMDGVRAAMSVWSASSRGTEAGRPEIWFAARRHFVTRLDNSEMERSIIR